MSKYIHSGPGTCNMFLENNIITRFIFPSKAIGCLIGRGGDRIKELRRSSSDQTILKIDGEGNSPERVLTIATDNSDQVVQVLQMIYNNIKEDFSDNQYGYPVIMHKGSVQTREDKYQLVMILSAKDCGRVVGKGGSTIQKIEEDSKARVTCVKEFESGDTLPNSDERLITFTGSVETIIEGLSLVLEQLKGQNSHYKAWDLTKDGPCNFFNNSGGRRSGGGGGGGNRDKYDARGDNSRFNRPRNNQFSRQNQNNLNPFIQNLTKRYLDEHKAVAQILVNVEQIGSIFGSSGSRIKDIRQQSGVKIKVNEAEGNSCFRIIEIDGSDRNCPGPIGVECAIWLMDVCINAFCPEDCSFAYFGKEASLEETVMSGLYGEMPGMQG